MNDIPLADILAFGVIAACIVMSMIRGVIAEAGSLFAWVISFLLAKTFAVPFSEVAFKSIQPRALGVAISFVVIFFLARFLQQFLRTILTNAAPSMGWGGGSWPPSRRSSSSPDSSPPAPTRTLGPSRARVGQWRRRLGSGSPHGNRNPMGHLS